MGLSTIFLSSATPWLDGEVADDCLASGVDVNMLDANGLLATAAEFREWSLNSANRPGLATTAV